MSTPPPTKPKEQALSVRVYGSFEEARAVFAEVGTPADAPFLRPEWLSALETTGCVREEKGWVPHHVAGYFGDDLLFVAPGYLKMHGEGEFVFDHAWANAARRYGLRYYPKLLFAVPFTPANGPRVLVPIGQERGLAMAAFAAAQSALCERMGVSGAHTLFLPEKDAQALGALGLAHRVGVQLHWENQDFEDFEGFLASLPQKRRTQIRRERRALREQGIEIVTLSGSELKPPIIDAMFEFYTATVDKFSWGRRYLNREFFEQVCSTMGDSIEIVMAFDAARNPVAGAFNLRGESTLFGRYWGAREELPFLHFNVCYYHPVETAIARKLARFEAGAGGEHKGPRGFAPTPTHSVHHLAEPRFFEAIEDYCTRERQLVLGEIGAHPDARREHGG